MLLKVTAASGAGGPVTAVRCRHWHGRTVVVFRLEWGVTGFRYGKAPELPEVSIRGFQGACYKAARATGGAVEQVVERNYPRNFHSAVIVGPTGRFALLCNAVYPWIAFVEEGTDGAAAPEAFADPPTGSTAFTEMGFTLMSRQLLESPLSVVDTAALGKAKGRRSVRSARRAWAKRCSIPGTELRRPGALSWPMSGR
jgi:hypothetical protein